jgi:Domain of unknown function (DUF4150)
MPQDGAPTAPLRVTVTPSLPVNELASSTGAFSRLGLDPAGNIQWNGGDNFSYFGKDWLENDNAQFENFDDPELAAAVRAQQAAKPPAAVWTTTPREMIRDGSRPIYTSTTPDVALTPRGSAVPPIPYDTWARPTHPLQFPRSVRATGQDVMVLRSQELLTYGAEQGVALGVASGTIMGPVQPLDHSTTVRAEGSYVIRDGDAVWMNNRNNLGVAQLEGSTIVNGPAPPADEPGFWAGLWQGAKDINNEYKILERGVGALQVVGGGIEAVVGGIAVAGGVAASTTGAGALVGVPTAIGGGALAAKGADDFWAGLQTVWTGNVTDTYLDTAVANAGTALGANEGTISVLQGVAGAVGNPANIVKEGSERLVREGAEAATERTVRETAGASAERTARVTASCYSIAMAAILVARANGVQYVGGPHNGVQTSGYESHHIPPKFTGGYTAGKGPAIQMDVLDHQATQTWGNSNGNRAQRGLANSSKAGFYRAIMSDIADVKRIAAASGDPAKYDVAIGMMLTYAACLAKEESGK